VTELLQDVRLLDLVDIGVVAALAWVGLRLVRRTRARPALLGLATLGAIYLAARQLGLGLTAAIFQAFFAVLVLVLVVVFQDDLRRIFEQVGAWVSRRGAEEPPSTGSGEVLVRSVEQLAASRTGALIVVPGREPIDRHVEGGIELDGRVSMPLLLSIFDASSPGHDGAVVIVNDRVLRFALHLPLSSDRDQLVDVGTRHAAALGLSERTDALCIVVSEERGTISIASGGRLRGVERPRALAIELRKHLRPTAESRSHSGWLQPRLRDALLAVGIAAGLWVVQVPGSVVAELEVEAPVVVEKLPANLRLEGIEPERVVILLSGRRRDLVLARNGTVEVRVDALLARLGRRTFEITPSLVDHPEGLEVTSIRPDRVKISIGKVPKAEPQPAPEPPRNGG
jgi:diadenylate cyclase